MWTFWNDLRHAFSGLRKNPGFAVVAILTLALGIGANTAIYSVVYGLLVRPLPYAEPDRLVVINQTEAVTGNISVTYPDFLDWQQRSRSFTGMAAMRSDGFNLAGIDQPERVRGMIVSPEFLTVLGVRPALGRDLSGQDPVVLVSNELWRSRLGGDESVIGRAITLDGRTVTVAGVLPRSFAAPSPVDIVAPFLAGDKDRMNRGAHDDMQVIARLAPGIPIQQGAREMDQIAASLAAEYPATNSKEGALVTGLRESIVGDSRMAVLVLFGAVCLILLIACANVANLLLVWGAARSREFAVRLALGAGRARLIRQMLTESLLLSVLGTLPGVALAWWGVRGLTTLIPPDTLPAIEIGIEPGVLLFGSGLALLAAMISGIVPAIRASRGTLDTGLKQGARSAGSTSHNRLSRGLAIAETALALVLAIGAGLMVKSMYLLYRVDPGFRTQDTVTMELTLDPQRYASPDSVQTFWKQAVARLRTIPGVSAAAAGTAIPLGGVHTRADVTIEGLPVPRPGEYPHPDIHIISEAYPAALGLPLLTGRSLEERDDAVAAPVVLVNALMARRYWGSEGNAVGKRILMGHPAPGNPLRTVVGVVGNTRLYGLAGPLRPEVYLPYTQRMARDLYFVVRHRGQNAGVIAAMRAQIATLDRAQPVFGIATMNQLVADSAPIRQMTMTILGLFSMLALLLSAIGIYGVMAYSAARRTREIGIRMALGAQAGQVMGMMMGSGLKLAAMGVGAGALAAALATRLLNSMLYATAAFDPATYAVVAITLFIVALGACYLPARRAMRVDPLTALRYE